MEQGHRRLYFCSGGSGYFTAAPEVLLEDQLAAEVARLRQKIQKPEPQLFSGSYQHLCSSAPPERSLRAGSAVRRHLRPVHRHPARCAEGGNNGLLKELNERTLLTVELGLQTIHERTARIINRGYDLQEFMEAYKALKIRGIRICVHLINGLPGETKRMMLESAAYLGQLRPEAVKIHMLHVLRDTPMETLYRRKKYRPLSRDEYIRLVCCQLRCFRQKL